MTMRKLNKEEIAAALTLAWQVFLQFEAPDYTQEGVDEFYKSIHDNAYVSALTFYGAFVKTHLVGVLATRKEGKHIALFFVEEAYQGQGIGRQLFEEAKCDGMTVNASPYAVKIYRKLGFADTDKEQSVNGLRFTPMVYTDKAKTEYER
ncbi:MAG: GNAT family N-acetyltransferase [Clostridia bacterium]|nr:GNAT family N-acetyltransferase [Clostridia bacterium]